MEIWEGRPHPALAGVVLRHTGFAQAAPGPVEMRELPCLYLPLIIDLDAGWTIAHAPPHDARPVHLGSFTAGLTDGPVRVAHAGTARCLQVDLDPLGARRLLRMPLSELANRTVALGDVIGGAAADALTGRVADAPGWAERAALVERALAARLADAPAPAPEVAWAVARLTSPGAPVQVAALAAELGCSHRRLIARVRDAVGLAPKRLARVARLTRVREMAEAAAAPDWARIAARCGYCDQAHMAREVRALTGLTPTGLRAAVNSVQDAPASPA